MNSIFESNDKLSYDNKFHDRAIWETDSFMGSVQQLRSINNNFYQSPEFHLVLGLCHSAIMTGYSLPCIIHKATNQLHAVSHSFLHDILLYDSIVKK